MREYLLPLLAVVITGLVLVAVPKLVALLLISRKARAQQPGPRTDDD